MYDRVFQLCLNTAIIIAKFRSTVAVHLKHHMGRVQQTRGPLLCLLSSDGITLLGEMGGVG